MNGTPARAAAEARPAASFSRGCLQELVGAGPAQNFERLESGRHRQGIAGKRSGLVNRACRRHPVHQRGLAAVSAHGQAAADDLAQGGEVRLNLEQLLRASISQKREFPGKERAVRGNYG